MTLLPMRQTPIILMTTYRTTTNGPGHWRAAFGFCDQANSKHQLLNQQHQGLSGMPPALSCALSFTVLHTQLPLSWGQPVPTFANGTCTSRHATRSNIRKPHLHMPTCYTFQHLQTACLGCRVLGREKRINTWSMWEFAGKAAALPSLPCYRRFSVGVRRQSRRPPNFIAGSVWEFAGQNRSPHCTASFCKSALEAR